MVLAISEAVSNSVEHAYIDQPAGLIDLTATVTTEEPRRVRLILRDYGRWRPPPAEDESRRRGIPVMRFCMDSVTIEPLTDDRGLPDGTRVTLTSKPVSDCQPG